MKQLIQVLLMLTLMPASVYADELQDGIDAYNKQDDKIAIEKFLPPQIEKAQELARGWMGKYGK